MKIVAILRGVTAERILTIAEILIEAGIRAIEVPLNSPDPLSSIEKLVKEHGQHCRCGAGTVLTPAQVDQVHDIGGTLIVSPNSDPSVIRRAVARDMLVMPGFITPTEAFAAIAAGARHLKLFPAASAGPAHLKALRSVLPPDIPVYAVGGIGAAEVVLWQEAGAAGFGFGSELFRPDYDDDEIARRARLLVAAVTPNL